MDIINTYIILFMIIFFVYCFCIRLYEYKTKKIVYKNRLTLAILLLLFAMLFPITLPIIFGIIILGSKNES